MDLSSIFVEGIAFLGTIAILLTTRRQPLLHIGCHN